MVCREGKPNEAQTVLIYDQKTEVLFQSISAIGYVKIIHRICRLNYVSYIRVLNHVVSAKDVSFLNYLTSEIYMSVNKSPKI